MLAGRNARAHNVTARRRSYQVEVHPVERSEPDLRRFARAILLHAQRETDRTAALQAAEPANEVGQ